MSRYKYGQDLLIRVPAPQDKRPANKIKRQLTFDTVLMNKIGDLIEPAFFAFLILVIGEKPD